jgi:hypothetical protein
MRRRKQTTEEVLLLLLLLCQLRLVQWVVQQALKPLCLSVGVLK